MKNWWKFIAVVAVLAMSALPTLAQTWFGPNGHTYSLIEVASWDEGEALAVGMGGHLVTINDAAENDWLTSVIMAETSVQRAWIGLYQDPDNSFESDMGWSWISGEAFSYANWNFPTGEPFDPDGDEDYGEMWFHTPDLQTMVPGSWNDTYSFLWTHAIVERDGPGRQDVPEPGTLALLAAAGTVGVGLLRRRPRV